MCKGLIQREKCVPDTLAYRTLCIKPLPLADDLSSFVALSSPCWWGDLAVWRNVLFSQLYYINTGLNLVNKAQAITSVLITFSNIYPH